MSDNSSMMMVVVIGGIMCCGMSCVGGLAGWYMYDPTLGGLLPGPALDGYTAAPLPAGDTPIVADPPPATDITPGKDVYIFSQLCADEPSGPRASILAGKSSTNAVGMSCDYKPENGYSKLWRFTKTGSLYYIELGTTKKYLTANPDATATTGDQLILATKSGNENKELKVRQQWYISRNATGGRSISLSQNAITKTFPGPTSGTKVKYRYLCFGAGEYTASRCAKTDGATPWMWFDSAESKWQFRLTKSTTPKMNQSCT